MTKQPLHAVVLWPIAMIYSLLMRVRALFFNLGVLPSEPSGAFVVSIGNLQAGGTGKTPFTVMLANRWKEKARLGIVSRGYRRQTKGVLRVDWQQADAADRFGDEPTLMAEQTRVPVYVGESRVAAALEIVAAEGTRLLLLDDGFQHLKLRRSFDIVLVDASAPNWHWQVLPAGRLREPMSALVRADFVVLTKTEAVEVEQWRELQKRLRRQLDGLGRRQVPIMAMRQELEIPALAEGASLFLVAGLANSSNFFELVKVQKRNVVGERAFRDHHSYTKPEVLEIKLRAIELGANMVLTTEKDFVKLKTIWESVGPSIHLEIAGLRLMPVDETDRVELERLDANIFDQTRILSRPDRR